MLAPQTVPASSTSIRKMEVYDIPAMREMAEDIWRKHYVPEVADLEQIEYMLKMFYCDKDIKSKLEKKSQYFWILHYNDKLAAYVAIEPRDNNDWLIDKIYVDMDIQRRGLGSTLLQHIIKEHAPKTLSLRVSRKNYKAVNFYSRHGFSITGMDVLDIGGGFIMDDFIMKKII